MFRVINRHYKALLSRRESYSEGKRSRWVRTSRWGSSTVKKLTASASSDWYALGFIGPKAEAQVIKDKLKEFLGTKLDLKMSEEKTHITHARNGKARFLGYDVNVAFEKVSRRTRRNGNIRLEVPYTVKQEWCNKYQEKGRPASRKYLTPLSLVEIVKTYDAELRGLYEYYKYANNVAESMSQIKWVMSQSLVRTIGRKLKMSPKAVVDKYAVRNPTGIQVKHNDHIAEFGRYSLARRTTFTKSTDEHWMKIYWSGRNELTSRLEADVCEVPNCENRTVEGHHIKSLKDLTKKYGKTKDRPWHVEMMIARRRKTIFVCKKHHRMITDGKYDGVSLKTIANWRA